MLINEKFVTTKREKSTDRTSFGPFKVLVIVIIYEDMNKGKGIVSIIIDILSGIIF